MNIGDTVLYRYSNYTNGNEQLVRAKVTKLYPQRITSEIEFLEDYKIYDEGQRITTNDKRLMAIENQDMTNQIDIDIMTIDDLEEVPAADSYLQYIRDERSAVKKYREEYEEWTEYWDGVIDAYTFMLAAGELWVYGETTETAGLNPRFNPRYQNNEDRIDDCRSCGVDTGDTEDTENEDTDKDLDERKNKYNLDEGDTGGSVRAVFNDGDVDVERKDA